MQISVLAESFDAPLGRIQRLEQNEAITTGTATFRAENWRYQRRHSRRPFRDMSSKGPDAEDGAKLLGHVVQLFFWEIRGQSIDVDVGRSGRI